MNGRDRLGELTQEKHKMVSCESVNMGSLLGRTLVATCSCGKKINVQNWEDHFTPDLAAIDPSMGCAASCEAAGRLVCEREHGHGGAHTGTIDDQDDPYLYKVSWWPRVDEYGRLPCVHCGAAQYPDSPFCLACGKDEPT
jgi:hypothetical protein